MDKLSDNVVSICLSIYMCKDIITEVAKTRLVIVYHTIIMRHKKATDNKGAVCTCLVNYVFV